MKRIMVDDISGGFAIDGFGFIYRLYSGNKVVYVGQTVNIEMRIGSHLRDEDKDFDSFDFFKVKVDQLNNEEAKEIVRLNPKLNKIIPQNDYFIGVHAVRKKFPVTSELIIKYLKPSYTCKTNSGRGGLVSKNYYHVRDCVECNDALMNAAKKAVKEYQLTKPNRRKDCHL